MGEKPFVGEEETEASGTTLSPLNSSCILSSVNSSNNASISIIKRRREKVSTINTQVGDYVISLIPSVVGSRPSLTLKLSISILIRFCAIKSYKQKVKL